MDNTFDIGGIRHESIEFIDVTSEDAKYMMMSCASFVNYLMEEWINVKK